MGSENQNVNSGNPRYEEFPTYPEFSPLTGETSSGKKQKIAVLSEGEQASETSSTKKKETKIETFFRKILLPTTVAAAAVLTAETIGIVGSPGVAIVGEPSVEVSTSETAGVYCYIELEGYSDGGDELAVEVYNDFERRREPMQVEPGDNQQEDGQSSEERDRQFAFGAVYDLKPDTEYTFEVLYGSWSLYKQKIRTAKQEEPWQDDPHEDPDTGDPAKPEFSATETEISYSIPISDYSEGDWFMVCLLENGDMIYEEEAADLSLGQEYIGGVFTDLQPGTEYLVQLMKNQEIVAEWPVSTSEIQELPPQNDNAYFSIVDGMIHYEIPVDESVIEPDIPVNFELSIYAVDDTAPVADDQPICYSYPEFVPNEDGTAFVSGSFNDITISGPGVYKIRMDKNVNNDWETIGIYRYELSEADFEMLNQ